jgi:hypothetical protein
MIAIEHLAVTKGSLMQLNPIDPYSRYSEESPIKEAFRAKQAQKLYTGILARNKASRLRNFLTGQSPELINLSSMVKSICVSNRHYTGVKSVEINKILGSEGRTKDFDISFRPLLKNQQSRWQSVANARLADIPLPPVELVQVGDTYFVRDGHHRISVAKALGEEFIEAVIVSWELCDPKIPPKALSAG